MRFCVDFIAHRCVHCPFTIHCFSLVLIPCQQEKDIHIYMQFEDIWICRGHCVCWLNRIKFFTLVNMKMNFKWFRGCILQYALHHIHLGWKGNSIQNITQYRSFDRLIRCTYAKKLNMRLYDSVTPRVYNAEPKAAKGISHTLFRHLSNREMIYRKSALTLQMPRFWFGYLLLSMPSHLIYSEDFSSFFFMERYKIKWNKMLIQIQNYYYLSDSSEIRDSSNGSQLFGIARTWAIFSDSSAIIQVRVVDQLKHLFK